MAIVILHRAALANAPYHDWLRNVEEPIYLIVSAAKLSAFNERIEDLPQGRYAAVKVVEGYDTSGEVELLVLDIARREPLRAILAHAEFDIERAARLRDYLGIPGQKTDSALVFRDKIAMKQAAQQAGIPVANFSPLENAPGLRDFVAANGLPVVMKPRNGAGACNITVLQTQTQVAELIQEGVSPPLNIRNNWMLESYVPGQTYHVDGLVLDGEIVLSWPSIYTTPSLDYLGATGQTNASHVLSSNNPLCARLNDFTAQVLTALPTPRNTAFHAELFHTHDGQLVLCEIASRTGGARICDAIAACFGVNISERWAQADCDLLSDTKVTRGGSGLPQPAVLGGWALIAPRPGRIEQLPSTCPLSGVVDFTLNIETKQVIGNPKAATDSIASCVFQAETETDCRATIENFRNWFAQECHISEVS
ncbi:ATP-grasp domain-containing protein [Halomonas eurihalina]|uniref:ATP-grasp domain-containing protein n=1 Tax=Halomonas eurihalina TaxID=42566 RepID=A0A5D9DAT2_HALER|nr:ATP-grasp domain-containing protein [Halomonas eurihalina]MDR5859270.1 ATP-grasp domain-containing protein [Halomonas eurihalina]TZG40906.1 ATP-grasp domain-containing protein [Halomonas eurihalina]